MGRAGHGDLRCSACDGHAHRRCLGLRQSAYPGGLFRCQQCVLRSSGLVGSRPAPAAVALASRLVSLRASAVAAGSGGTYDSSRQRFVTFCTQVLGTSVESVLPTRPVADINKEQVCLFLAYAAERYARSTIEGTVSALVDWQRSRGVPPSASIRQDPEVRVSLAAALRAQPDLQQLRASALSGKAPLPLPALRALVGFLAGRAAAAPVEADLCTVDACWLVLGFFGLLRRSELVGLRVGHVAEFPGGGIELFLPRSKTDQQGRGSRVFLAPLSGSGVPVARIVLRHLGMARSRGVADAAPLFARLEGLSGWGRGLNKADFTRRLRQRLEELQSAVPGLIFDLPSFSSHSLRKGGATAAADAGVNMVEIQQHGRWRSSAVLAYTQSAARARFRVVEAM